MPIQNCIPFPISAYVTSLAGLSLGQKFVDPSTGYEYRLAQMHTVLTNDTTANKEVLCETATKHVVTQKTTSAGNTTYPKAYGIACGAIPESTASTTYYGLLLTRGEKLVLTDGGDDIAIEDYVCYDAGTDTGRVDLMATSGTDVATPGVTKFGELFGTMVGRALAADSATEVLVSVDIKP